MMGRRSRFLLLLLLSGAVASTVRGNVTPAYKHDLWNTETGFPGGYVYAITQTADGYLWIGTSKGLIRFDGLSFAPIRESDLNPDTNFPVWGLLTDFNDQLWVMDDQTHLYKYSTDHLVGPLPDNGRHQYHLSPLVAKTREGWLLFGSAAQGLVEYRGGSPRVLLDPALMPNLPTAIAQTADGTSWIGTEGLGLFRVTSIQGAPQIQHIAALTNTKINCLLPIGASTLLIGTGKGLLALRDGKLIEASSEFRNLEILSLANGMRGDVWIGAQGQVFKARAEDIDQTGQIDSLDRLGVNGTVTALFEDRDGDLWIGGPEKIQRYLDNGFISYLSSSGMPCANCGAIYADQHDRVWFAPWDGGLFRLSQGVIEPIEVAGLKNDTVYSIAGGADDEVWVGRKYGGITRLTLNGDALQASTYTQRDGLSQDSVSSIYRAPDGTVWAGTVSGGLSRFRDGTWRTFTTREGLPSNRISVVTGNAAGEIFVGTPTGLAVLKNDHWVIYAAHDGLPPGTVESLFAEDSGTLWIGTTKGIAFLQSGTVHVPLGAPTALYEEILGIAENDGWLWIATQDHVLRVRRTALLKQLFGESDYRAFGAADGLPSSEGVKRSSSVVKDYRRRIWFSLNQGISVLQPSAFTTPAFPGTLHLDTTLVDGKPVESQDLIRLPAGQHRFTFRYAGVNVSNPDGVRYRYRLDRVDSGWSEPTTLREIDYTNIPPGKFQFHVIARNPGGVWGKEESTGVFEVEPAFWQTLWFRAGGLAFLILLIWMIYWIRVRSVEQRYLERSRTEELLRRAQAELAHINRVSTMGELTASLAHEIKQPIGAAVTNAEACLQFLGREQPDLPEAREAAVEMARDARRAADIIEHVRSLYRKDSLPQEIVDVNEVIREMVVILGNEASRHSVRLRSELCEDLPDVVADRVQFQQVLMNLMLNGIEAMGDGSGELRIKSQLSEDGQLLISVSDTGVGLPTGKADQIFNAFFTTKSQGTGLGLAITRSIVESHGGRIWATANSGPGATFQFTLPPKKAAHT